MVFPPVQKCAGRATRISLVLAVGALLLAGSPAARGADGPDAAAAEQELIARLDALRAGRGAPALTYDSRLSEVARQWSARMAATGTLAHMPDLAAQVGADWTRLGQNVGAGTSAAAVQDGLVASASHLSNMVSTSFNSVGVGAASAAGRLWVTQVFMSAPPAARAAAPADVSASSVPVPAGTAWYRLAGASGETYSFGAAAPLPRVWTSSPVVAGAATAGGAGSWLATTGGAVFALGDAPFLGSLAGRALNQPVVGMAATPSGQGYWLVARDGGIFSFGDARFLGSTGGMRLNQPIVGMAATPSGAGYWFVAADGGIFAFGDARFAGSTGALTLNSPVVGMASSKAGQGYWLVARDGGIFAFGDTAYHGSTGAAKLNQPIVGMSRSPSGNGYRFVAADGGVFSFGDAPFLGSSGGQALPAPVTAMVAGG